MLSRQGFGLFLALIATRPHQDEFRPHGCRGFTLKCRGPRRHYDGRSYAECAGSIGDTLRVISTGVSNDAAPAFFWRQGRDFVVSAPQLERPDGLQVFRLQVEKPVVLRPVQLVKLRGQQAGAHSNPVEPRLRLSNVIQTYDANIPRLLAAETAAVPTRSLKLPA